MDTVVFDKTGTLTAGRPTVVGVRPSPGQALGAAQLLALAAAVEQGSTHPIARAILGAAAAASTAAGGGGGGAPPEAAKEGSFQQEPGSGVTATVGRRTVSVGTLEWVTRGQPGAAAADGGSPDGGQGGGAPADEEAAAATAATRPGHILVYVGVDGGVAGSLEVADEPRPDAAATVARLGRLGVRAYMLSGDRAATALALAGEVGIPAGRVFAGVKPAGKAALVARLQAEGRRVAMVSRAALRVGSGPLLSRL